jgi:hypothetical protein
MTRYDKLKTINLTAHIVFTLSSFYLAYFYYIEHPYPELHWEGIVPISLCLFYYLFGPKA